MRVRKIRNLDEVCQEINSHFPWELEPFFPGIDLSKMRGKKSYNFIRCPFHKEKTPSFHYSLDFGVYYCYGCGAGGDLIQFFMNMKNLNFIPAVIRLAKFFKIKLVWKRGY